MVMGADFSSHQCFTGNSDTLKIRSIIIDEIRQSMIEMEYREIDSEQQADRSFVVGPMERWIWVGDSTGSTDNCDCQAFTELSRRLSKLVPMVDILMSDSAAVHFYLYANERLIDKYGNAAFPFYKFKTPEEASEFIGKPELWEPYPQNSSQIEKLRSVWVQKWEANVILSQTMQLFEMNPLFYYVGYTHDDEGIGIKYDRFLFENDVTPTGFNELHFQH